MDREAWHAAIHGVSKSWTRLSDWTELTEIWSDFFPLNSTALNLLVYLFVHFRNFPLHFNVLLLSHTNGTIQILKDILIETLKKTNKKKLVPISIPPPNNNGRYLIPYQFAKVWCLFLMTEIGFQVAPLCCNFYYVF